MLFINILNIHITIEDTCNSLVIVDFPLNVKGSQNKCDWHCIQVCLFEGIQYLG